MEFFEPEDAFKIEKIKKRNIKTKISLLTVLIIFGSALVLMVNFDFINIFKEKEIKQFCTQNNSYNRVEDEYYNLKNVQKNIDDHLGSFKELSGFLKVEIKFEKNNSEKKIPVINFIFKKLSTDKSRIPETICGFKTLVTTQND